MLERSPGLELPKNTGGGLFSSNTFMVPWALLSEPFSRYHRSLVFRTALRSGDLYIPHLELGKLSQEVTPLAKVVCARKWQGFMFKGAGPWDPYSSHSCYGALCDAITSFPSFSSKERLLSPFDRYAN